MRVFKVLCVLALLVTVAVAKKKSNVARPMIVPPGVLGAISQPGAQYLAGVALPIVVSKMESIVIPDWSGNKDGFDVSVKNIHVGSLSFTSDQVSLKDDGTLSVSGIALSLSLDWSYRLHSWPHFPNGGGSADGSVSNSGMSLSLSGVATPSGQLQLKVDSISVSIHDLSIKVHGSIFSWLYDLIIDLAKGFISSKIQDAIQQQVPPILEAAANAALSTVQFVVPLPALHGGAPVVQVDLGLTQNPLFSDQNFLALFMKGQFENITNPQPCPMPHIALEPELPKQMMSVQLDEYFFNSGLWIAYVNGYIDFTVTDAMIPKESPLRLNTSVFKQVIPGLFQQFPNDLIEIEVRGNAAPTVSISPSGSLVTLSADMIWSGLNQTTYYKAFNLGTKVACSMDFSTNGTSIVAHLKFINITLTLESSNVGKFDVTPLNGFFNAIISGPVITLVNQALAKGFPLPSIHGMSFVNPLITEQQGYVTMTTDVNYTPQREVYLAMDNAVRRIREARLARH